MTCCYGDVLLFTNDGIIYIEIISRILFYVTIVAMHVVVKCSFLLIFYCKLKIKVKLEDDQLRADCFPCFSFSCSIAIGFQALVNTTPGIIVPK